MENLRDLAFELDNDLGLIHAGVETLGDVVTLLQEEAEMMDEGANKGEEKLYYFYIHRKIRALSKLLNYTFIDLCTNFENASKTRTDLFDIIVKEKGKCQSH